MGSPPHDPFAIPQKEFEVFKESGKEKEPNKGGDHSLVELGLGLGFGFGSSSESSSSSSPCAHLLQSGRDQAVGLGLKLGLGLGSENGSWSCFSDGHGVEIEAPRSVAFNYHHKGLWWGSHHIHDGHHYHQDMPRPPPSSTWSVPHDCLLRPHQPAGLWFTLRSSLTWEGEVLPQIPKAYIRVKDENVTVFMVKTYLVTKLGLSNQDQVEISCMGQKLMHSQSLKHVRDAIWFPRLVEVFNSNPTLFQDSKGQRTLTYLMPLDYGPTNFTNK